MTLTCWRYQRNSPVVPIALLILCWQSAAQNPGGSQPPPTSGSGPYKAVMEMDAGLPDHTIYRPEDLSALNGVSLPIVVWGNGACVNAGNAFQNFLTDISSYGFLVVALGPIVQRNTNANAPPQAPVAPPSTPADTTELPRNLPPAATHPSQMIDAINWAIAENERAGSKYYKQLDSRKIAVMGQSCGGVQAIEVAADRRVTTAVIWNSGLFAKPTNMGGGKTLSKRDLESIHVPVAYISGDPQGHSVQECGSRFRLPDKSPGVSCLRTRRGARRHLSGAEWRRIQRHRRGLVELAAQGRSACCADVSGFGLRPVRKSEMGRPDETKN